MEGLSKITIFLWGLLMTGCMPMMNMTSIKNNYPQIPESTKTIDIPKYDEAKHGLNGFPYVYWNFCKQKQKQLELDSPETSSDSLIYRMWITNPVSRNNQPHGLIEIKYDSTKWSGKLIFMFVNFNSKNLTESITKSKMIELQPLETNWESVVDSLFKYQIDILPTDEKIPDYYTEESRYSNNASTFSFEYATRSIYRFYQYSNIYRVSDKFWQAENIVKIGDLLEREFKWHSLGEEYFK